MVTKRRPSPQHRAGTEPSSNPHAGRSPWVQAVERAVRAIPKGQTVGYATVALWAGKPGAARAVVRALHAAGEIPWWRVTRSDGTLAPQVAAEQARRLAREGVVVVRGKVAPAKQRRAPRA